MGRTGGCWGRVAPGPHGGNSGPAFPAFLPCPDRAGARMIAATTRHGVQGTENADDHAARHHGGADDAAPAPCSLSRRCPGPGIDPRASPRHPGGRDRRSAVSELSRREVLRWSALGLAAATLAGCGGTPPPLAPTGRIDVHQHMIPDAYRRWLATHGALDVGGIAVPEWSASAAMASMDRTGTAKALCPSRPRASPAATTPRPRTSREPSTTRAPSWPRPRPLRLPRHAAAACRRRRRP